MSMVVLGLCSPVSCFGWLPSGGGGARLKAVSFSAACFPTFLWRLGFMSYSWHQNLTNVIPSTGGSSSDTHQGQWSKADVWRRVQKWNKHMMILFQIFSQQPEISGSVQETTWVGRLLHSPCENTKARGPLQVPVHKREQTRIVSSPCSCRLVTSLGLQRHGGIAHRTGMLQLADTGFSRKTGWEGKE